MSDTFNVFFLGTLTSMDPTEGNPVAENAGALVGMTFGSAGDPLHQHIQSLSPGSTGYAGGTNNAYDMDNTLSNDTFRIDGGADQTFDATAVFSTTLNYADGTSAVISGVLFQDTAGNTYLAPEYAANADQTALEAKAIESIRLDSLTTDTFTGLSSPRELGDYETPDGTVDGTSGNDLIDGSTADAQGDRVDGWDGDADTILAGDGDDTIRSGNGADSIQAGAGNDSIDAGAGDDTIYDDAGNDSIEAGTGDDSLFLGGGADTALGGSGDDTFTLSTMTTGTATLTGGEGGETDGDKIVFTGADDVTVLFSGDEAGTFSGGTYSGSFSEVESIRTDAGDDTVTASADTTGVQIFTGSGSDSVLGGGGSDEIFGGADDDTLDGGSGSDDLYGEDGLDSLSGGSGSDFLDGGAGEDTLLGGTGSDSLEGGAGNDSLLGESGGDTLSGGSGADTLDGGTGDDSLSGGTGADRLTGGGGDDTFSYSPGDGLDTITDFNTGNTGAIGDSDNTNNDFVDLSGYYDSLGELYADQADDGILNQSNTLDDEGNATDYSDNLQFAPGDGIQFTGAAANSSFFTADNTGVVCFTPGTWIRTLKGDMPITQLRPGDLIVTRDNGLKPLLWIGRRHLGWKALRAAPQLRPVELKAGVLGFTRDTVVSQQHGVLLRDPGRGGDEVLYRAAHLARLPGGGARIMIGCRAVTYYHFLLDGHEIVYANGRPSETLYPALDVLRKLSTSARAELRGLFPDLGRKATHLAFGSAARAYSRTVTLPRHLDRLRTLR